MHLQRSRRFGFVALALAALVTGVASPALAAPADRTITQPLSGTAAPISLFDTGLQVCDACVPDVFVSGDRGHQVLRSIM